MGVLIPQDDGQWDGQREKGGREGSEGPTCSNRLRRCTPRFTQHSRAMRTPAGTRPALCRASVHRTRTALARRRHRPTARDARRTVPLRSRTSAARTRDTGMAVDDAPAFGPLAVAHAHACVRAYGRRERAGGCRG